MKKVFYMGDNWRIVFNLQSAFNLGFSIWKNYVFIGITFLTIEVYRLDE